jgi:hypothetical protein
VVYGVSVASSRDKLERKQQHASSLCEFESRHRAMNKPDTSLRVVINDQPWHLIFATRKRISEEAKKHQLSYRLNGMCDWDARTIWIYRGLTGKELMDTITHEYFHAKRGDCTEEWVTQAASELTDIQFDVLGYRRMESHKDVAS